jgi:hypothetical protein
MKNRVRMEDGLRIGRLLRLIKAERLESSAALK